MKRLLPKTGRDLLMSLVLGASALGGSAYGQDTATPTNLPAAVPEIAPRAQPTTFGTAKGATFIVPLGGSKQLQMSSGKPIRTVYNRQDDVTSVEPTSDRTRLLVTGKKAGTSQITLIAEDQTKEVVDVVVEPDMEYLRSLLIRAVPTANLNLIGAASGSIIISGTVTKAEDIEIILNTARAVVGAPAKIINAMRVSALQAVQLDVVIATVDRSKFRNFGFEFVTGGQNVLFGSTFSGSPLVTAAGTPAAAFNWPALAAGSNIATGIYNLGSGRGLFGFLTSLAGEGVSKLLAEPSVVALSGHPAQFYSGGEQAVPTISGGSSASTAGVDFKPFGTTLQVLPIVLGDGKIYLEVDPKVDNPSKDPLLGAPIPGTSGTVAGRTGQEVHTSVVMEDGQTYVIGGLIQRTMNASTQRLPVLGSCPVIGPLFRTTTYTEGEQELVILITPHLVDASTCGQLPHYLPGQETRSADDYELFYESILEAPHGCREVFPNGHYRPAYLNMNQGCSGGSCAPATSDPAPVHNGAIVGSATPNPANVAPVPVPPSPPSAAMTADAPAPVTGTDNAAPTAKGL